jgi:hypothetical protein
LNAKRIRNICRLFWRAFECDLTCGNCGTFAIALKEIVVQDRKRFELSKKEIKEIKYSAIVGDYGYMHVMLNINGCLFHGPGITSFSRENSRYFVEGYGYRGWKELEVTKANEKRILNNTGWWHHPDDFVMYYECHIEEVQNRVRNMSQIRTQELIAV